MKKLPVSDSKSISMSAKNSFSLEMSKKIKIKIKKLAIKQLKHS